MEFLLLNAHPYQDVFLRGKPAKRLWGTFRMQLKGIWKASKNTMNLFLPRLVKKLWRWPFKQITGSFRNTTLQDIIRQAGLSLEEFKGLI